MAGRLVLLLDRDRANAARIERTLAGDGHTIVTATNPDQAFDAFLDRAPDLVVLGDDHGGQLHERIRDAGETVVPVIHCVHPGDRRAQATASTLGAAAVLEHPVDLERLAAIVRGDVEMAPDPATSTSRGSLRLLVVEDDEDQRAVIDACLEAGGRETVETVYAGTIAEARRLIRETRFHCVLVDHSLPDGRGLDLLEEVDDHLITTPVIGFSAALDPETVIEYYRAGCIDFFSKAKVLRSRTLRRGIATAMSRFQRRAMATILERQQLRHAIVESQERMISLARIDQLTGICNRAVFDDFHPQLHEETTGRGSSYALCMVDVDHFKSYNDRYGHAAGDVALRRIAQVIAATLRDNDFIARYGGEELVVLLDTGRDNVKAVAARIKDRVHAENIVHEGSREHGRITVSVGVSVFEPENRLDTRPMLLEADQALYRAKESGRNCIVVAPPVAAGAVIGGRAAQKLVAKRRSGAQASPLNVRLPMMGAAPRHQEIGYERAAHGW